MALATNAYAWDIWQPHPKIALIFIGIGIMAVLIINIRGNRAVSFSRIIILSIILSVIVSLIIWDWFLYIFKIGLVIGVIAFILAAPKIIFSSPFYTSSSSSGGHHQAKPQPANRPGSVHQSVFPGIMSMTLFHGTPTIRNALSIARGAGTWIVCEGNAYGTGVYLAEQETAKEYAGSNGGLLKVRLSAPANQIASHDKVTSSINFANWRRQHGTDDTGDDIAIYVTEVLGKRFLKVRENLFVALVDPAHKHEAVSFQGLTVLAVYDRLDNQIR